MVSVFVGLIHRLGLEFLKFDLVFNYCLQQAVVWSRVHFWYCLQNIALEYVEQSLGTSLLIGVFHQKPQAAIGTWGRSQELKIYRLLTIGLLLFATNNNFIFIP